MNVALTVVRLEGVRIGIGVGEEKDIRKEELKKEIHGKIVKKDK